MFGLPTVAIEQVVFDVRAVVDRAADRIGCAVVMRLSPAVDSLQGTGKLIRLQKEQP